MAQCLPEIQTQQSHDCPGTAAARALQSCDFVKQAGDPDPPGGESIKNSNDSANSTAQYHNEADPFPDLSVFHAGLLCVFDAIVAW